MNKISLDNVNLNKRGCVVRTTQQYESENKDIHYVYSGKFCRMAPNSRHISCIEKMTKKIDLFESMISIYIHISFIYLLFLILTSIIKFF